MVGSLLVDCKEIVLSHDSCEFKCSRVVEMDAYLDYRDIEHHYYRGHMEYDYSFEDTGLLPGYCTELGN